MSIVSEKIPKISHYLGMDYGESKIGLALADKETRMAFAYKALKNDSRLIDNLAKEIREKSVQSIVIGIPSYFGGGKIKNSAEKLGKLLEDKLNVDVFYQNEMFTTKMAQKNLIEAGRKSVSRADDAEAARIILQEWLDKQ